MFQEYDFSVVHPTHPSAPLWESVVGIFGEFIHRALRRTTGTQLYQLAAAAGFCSVVCRAEYPLDGGANSPFYEWIAESLRSILSRAEALGLVRGAELEMDTLAERLRKEAVANGSSRKRKLSASPRNGWMYRAQTVERSGRDVARAWLLGPFWRTAWLDLRHVLIDASRWA